MNGWYAAIKVLKNALCFIMGVFGCHGNTCYVIFIGAIFYMIYSTGKINVCTDFEINRFRIDVMWRKNATSCVMGIPTLMIDILTRNILKPTRGLYDFRFRSYGSNSGFRVFLDLDLWHMFFFFVTRIAHDILEYLCEVSLESVQYEWVICCG